MESGSRHQVAYIIKTNRTYLRQFRQEDLRDLLPLMQNKNVVRYTSFEIVPPKHAIESKLDEWILDSHVWCVRNRESDEFIGWFMLKPTDLPFYEIGFMLLESEWNQGYTTEVGTALIEYGRKNLKLTQIMARVVKENIASQKVLKKLGMKEYKYAHTNSKLLFFVLDS